MEFEEVMRLSKDRKRETGNGERGLFTCIFLFSIVVNRIILGDFQKLRVWQEAIDLAIDIYRISRKVPFVDDFGLCNQIQRAAVSVASNIAEGDEREMTKSAIYFFNIAKGSLAETITQLHIAYKIGYIDKQTQQLLVNKAEKIIAMLRKLIKARAKTLQ